MGIFDIFARKDSEYYKVKFFESNEIYQKARKAINEGNTAKGFKLYCKAAEGYNWMAKYMVGYCYEAGTGVPKDNKKAFEIYSKIASDTYEHGDYFSDFMNRSGIAIAKYRMGLFLQNGWDIPKDTARAVEIFSNMNVSTDGAEATYLAAIEMNINYHHGINGCPQDFSMSHKYALKALEAFRQYENDSHHFGFNFDSNTVNNHRIMMQYAAYNYENGRGVPKDIDKALQYRLQSLGYYNTVEDFYWAGVDYYSLNNVEEAEKMLEKAYDAGNADWKKWAREKLNEIDSEREKAYKEAEEIHLANVERGLELNIFREVKFRMQNYRKLYVNEAFGDVIKVIVGGYESNLATAIELVLGVVRKDITDNTPLPEKEFKKTSFPAAFSVTKVLEDYARCRLMEKSGQDFNSVYLNYSNNSLKGHIESTYRMANIDCYVSDNRKTGTVLFDTVKKEGRPVYNTSSTPTLGIVQLAEKQDVEAIVDLARMYRHTDHKYLADALSLIAETIYEHRAQAGDPEATYNLGCIVAQAEMYGREKMSMFHSMVHLWHAFSLRYAKAYADFTSDAVSGYLSDKEKSALREIANKAGAVKKSYFPYLSKEDYNRTAEEASEITRFQNELWAENPDSHEAKKRGYFKKVLDFAISQKPFTDPEMQQFIADGVIDDLGDKPLAEIIKRAANPPLEEMNISKEQLNLAKKEFRKIFFGEGE